MTRGRFPFGQGSQTVSHLHDIGGRPIYGNTYFVDSGNTFGNDSASEGTKAKPFATLDYAVGHCTANQGDVIYLAPGHTETITLADQVDLDVAGISIIGCGNGTDRPTFTYTVAAGEVIVGADNIRIDNCIFTAGAPDVLLGVTIEDGVDYCTISNCVFDSDSYDTNEFAAVITLVNNNTGCIIENCIIDAGLGNSASGIDMTADTEGTVIRNNKIQGDFSVACINGDTTLSTEVLIQGNILQNGDTGGIGAVEAIVLLTGTTGIIADNYIMCNVANNSASITGDAVVLFNNVYSETVNTGVGIADSHAAVT